MKQLTLFPLLLLSVVASTAFASSLYSAKVVLEENTKQEELNAKQVGFKEVLFRISGTEKTLELPEIKERISKVDQFINQVSFENIDGDKSRVAILTFDKQKILELLKKSQANYWNENRPKVLFWLVDADDNRIIWEQTPTTLITELRDAANRRGIPVSIPVGDIDDLINITEKELLGNFYTNVMDSSLKYQPDAVVIAKIENKLLSWQFFPDFDSMDEVTPLQGQAVNTNKNSAYQMIDEISDYYVNSTALALKQSETKSLRFELHGVEDSDEFFHAERILKQMHSVSSVFLHSIKNSVIIFDLSIYDGAEFFESELAKIEQIQPLVLQNNVELSEKDSEQLMVISDNHDVTQGEADSSTSESAQLHSANEVDNEASLDEAKLNKTLVYQWW